MIKSNTFHDKNTQRPQPYKDSYKKPIANNTLNCERLDVSLKIRNKTKMFTLTTSIQHGIGGSTHGNLPRKENRRHQVEKKEVKLFLQMT